MYIVQLDTTPNISLVYQCSIIIYYASGRPTTLDEDLSALSNVPRLKLLIWRLSTT